MIAAAPRRASSGSWSRGGTPASSAAALELAGATRGRCGRRRASRTTPPQVDDAGLVGVAGLAAIARVVAIGETGLDYDRIFRRGRRSRPTCDATWAWPSRRGKPAILHCRSAKGERDAQDELIAELRAGRRRGARGPDAFGGRPPAVLHSFSGPVDYAEAAVEMGLAISFSGLVFRRG